MKPSIGFNDNSFSLPASSCPYSSLKMASFFSNSKKEDHKVDYKLIVEKLEQCGNAQNDNVTIAEYLDAYKQIRIFFTSMGKIFDIVSSDINAKITILEEYMKSDAGKNYNDVRSMLEYESSNNLLKNSRKPSGSRTLLRLHRGLEFVYVLLENIIDLPPDENIVNVAQAAYKGSLGKFHSWAIYYAMLVALNTLSTSKDLVHRTADQSTVDEFLTEIAPSIIRVGKNAHEIMQTLYREKGCLELK